MSTTPSDTPRTYSTAKRAYEALTSCKTDADFKTALKSLTKDFIDTSKSLERELAQAKALAKDWLDVSLEQKAEIEKSKAELATVIDEVFRLREELAQAKALLEEVRVWMTKHTDTIPDNSQPDLLDKVIAFLP